VSICEIDGITRHFGGVAAVSDVGFSVEEGAIVAVIGPNGAGKTTLINLVTGVLQPQAGRVSFQGRDITGVPLHRLARTGLTRTYQHPRVFRNMTVLDNVIVGAQHRHSGGFLASGLKLPVAGRAERAAAAAAREALERVNLDCDPLMPSDLLTPGQDKLLELARVVAGGPELVFLDEPAAGLDDHETADLGARIAELNRNGLTVVLVEHNMQMVMSLSHHVVVMDSGVKIAEGTPGEIRSDPRVIEAYLGKGADLTGVLHD
jgi:ABC-type branched-subunit amino acid transport system ATPase component